MSGVIIDVDSKTESARRDLEAVNKSLVSLIKNSNASSASLGRVQTDSFRTIGRDLNGAVKALAGVRDNGPKAFKATNEAAGGLVGTLGSLKTAAIAVGTAFLALKGIGTFNRMADDLTNIQNRLKLVTDGSDALLRTQSQLYKLSSDTRSSFAATSSLYVDFTKSLEASGKSQSKVLSLVNTVQQAAALSGSSATATAAAITQLGQGLASGVLRGEEFNSVTEQMKYLSIGLAKALGKTQGELRAMAGDGLLTVDLLTEGLERMAKATDSDFKKTSITVEQAMGRLSSAVSFAIGDFSKYYGISDRFAKRLTIVAGAVDSFHSGLIVSSALLKQSIKNYIDQFDLFDAAELTVRAAMRLEISPLDAVEKYQQYKTIKSGLDKFRDFVGTKKDLSIKVKAPTTSFAAPSGEAPEAPELDAMDKLRVALGELKSVGYETGRAVYITFAKLATLLPDVEGPVIAVTSRLSTFIKNVIVDFNAATYDAVVPFARAVDSITEPLSLFLTGDTALERSWVNLFKSDSIKDFTKNLRKLNDVRQDLDLSEFSYSWSEAGKSLRTTLKPVRDTLVALDLMDNRLLRVRNTNLDRVIKYFETLSDVIRRVYSDVFATTVEPIIAKTLNQLKLFGSAVTDALSDIFSESSGEKAGKALVAGFGKALRGLKNLFKGLSPDTNTFDALFGNSITERAINGIVRATKAVGSFIKGLFSGIFDSIADAVSPSLFTKAMRKVRDQFLGELGMYNSVILRASAELTERISSFKFKYFFDFDKSAFDKATYYVLDMFDKILRYSTRKLLEVERSIADFGRHVKDTFFDVYDAVVGHSYWPDMVDGVVSYTTRIFKASDTITRFGNFIRDSFSKLSSDILDMGGDFGTAVNDFVDRLRDVDWSSAFSKLSSSLGATIFAGLALVFGEGRLKLLAVNYFFSLFNVALGGAFNAFAPIMASTLGSTAGVLADHVIEGIIKSFNVLVEAAPKFATAILHAFSPVTGGLATLLDSIPGIGFLFSNSLVHAIGLAAAALALFTKNGSKQISELVFGKDRKNKGRQEGIADYVKSVFNFKPSAGDTGSLLSAMFPKKNLALAAAAVMSTAIMDSISFMDAAVFAVPLLGFAMLGRDGGARLAQDTASFLVNLVVGGYRSASASLDNALGGSSLIARMFAYPLNRSSTPPAVKTGIALAAQNVFDTFKQSFVNLRANVDSYAKGGISLSEAFTDLSHVGPLQPGKKTELSRAVKDLFTEIGSVKFNNKPLRDYFNAYSSFVKDSVASIKAKYAATDILGTVSAASTTLFNSIKGSVGKATSLISDGLVLLGTILRSKLFLFSALAAGFSATAFAASDASSAVGILGSSLSGILVTVVAVTTALGALGAASRLGLAYKQGVADLYKEKISDTGIGELQANAQQELSAKIGQEFKEASKRRQAIFEEVHAKEVNAMWKLQAQSMYDIEQQTPKPKRKALRDTLYDSNALDRKAFSRAKLAEFKAAEAAMFAEAMKSDVRLKALEKKQAAERLAAIGGVGAERAAGFAAVRAQIGAGFTTAAAAVGTFLVGIGKVIASPALAFKWWADRSAAMKQYANTVIFTELVTARLSLANKRLAESFALLKAGELMKGTGELGKALGALFSAVGSGGAKAAKDGVLGTLTGVKDMAAAIPKYLGKVKDALVAVGVAIGPVFKALMGLLKIPLLIAAAVTVVGTIGLWLFGPGTTFIDNLEWAYDKVKSLFGLQPTTKGGRQIAIGSTLKPREIDGESVDFSAELDKIDYSKLSAPQTKVLLDLAAATKEGFDNLETAFISQGYLNAEQIAEFKRLGDTMKGVISRQPSVTNAPSFGDAVKTLSKQITSVDNSLWAMFKRMVGYKAIVTELDYALSGSQVQFNKTAATIRSSLSYILESFTSWPAIIGAAVGGIFGGIPGMLLGALAGSIVSMLTDLFVKALPVIFGVAIGAFFGPLGIAIGAALGGTIMYFEEDLTNFLGDLGASLKKFNMLVGGSGELWSVITTTVLALIPPLGLLALALLGIKEIVDAVVNDFKNAFEVEADAEQKKRAKDLEEVSAKAVKYNSNLPPEVQKLLDSSLADLQAAQKQVDGLKARGFRGLEERRFGEYQKALDIANKRLSETQERYNQFAKVFGDFGEENFKIDAFNKSMEKLSSEAKTLLDLDLGKFSDKLVGNESDVVAFQELIEKARAIAFKKTRAFTIETRAKLKLDEEDVQRQAKEMLERIQQKARFETALEYDVKLVGIDASADDLRRLTLDAQDSAKAFTDASDGIFELQKRIKGLRADASAEDVRALFTQLGSQKLSATAAARTDGDYTQLTKRAQAAGLDSISTQQFLGFDETELRVLGSSIDRVRNAQQALLNLSTAPGPKPFKAQIDALKELQSATLAAKVTLKSTIASQIAEIADSGESPAFKAAGVASVTGTELPAVSSTTVKGLSAYTKLMIQKSTLEEADARMQMQLAEGTKISADAFAKNRAELLRNSDALSKLEERLVYSLDSLSASFSDIGIDTLAFAGLGIKAQRSLIAIGTELDAINKKFSELPAGTFVGEALKAKLARQQKLMEDAQKIAKGSFLKTGEKISEALGDIGVNAFANLSGKAVSSLLDVAAKTSELKFGLKQAFDTSDEKGIEKYLALMKALEKRTKDVTQVVEDLNQTVQTRLSSVNEVFGTSLDERSFLSFGESFGNSLADGARKLKRELDLVYSTGKTSSGQLGAAFLDSFKVIQRSAPFLTFFADMAKGVEDSLYEGAKAGFDRIKSVLPNVKGEFSDFTKLSGEQRKALSLQATQVDMLSKAAELPYLTKGLVDILGSYTAGDNIADVMSRFKAQFQLETGKTLEDAIKSATELNTSALEKNTEWLSKLYGEMTGQPSDGEKPKDADKSTSPSDGAYAKVPASFYKELEKTIATNGASTNADIFSKMDVRKRIVTNVPSIDASVLNTASKGSLAVLDKLAEGLSRTEDKLKTATGDTAKDLQMAANAYTYAITDITDTLRTQTTAVRDAGKAFSQSIESNFETSFADYLKGKSKDDQGALEVFRDSITSSWSAETINTFAKGISSRIFGGGSGLGDLLSEFGGGIFEMAAGEPGTEKNPYYVVIKEQNKLDKEKAGTIGSFPESIKSQFSKAMDYFKSTPFETIFKDGLSVFKNFDFGKVFDVVKGMIGGASAGTSLLSIFGLASGGYVSGPGTGTSDSIPAMLSNGEYVVKAAAVKQFGPLLHSINKGTFGKFAEGGLVSTGILTVPSMSEIPRDKLPESNGSQQIINVNVTGDISRQTRKEIYEMLPSIANGVNSHNRERNYRG